MQNFYHVTMYCTVHHVAIHSAQFILKYISHQTIYHETNGEWGGKIMFMRELRFNCLIYYILLQGILKSSTYMIL